MYGVEGQKQHGIDIVAVKRTQPVQRPSYYQCKNVDTFSGSDLRAAVQQFSKGPFAKDATELTVIVRAPSKTRLQDENEHQRRSLLVHQIEFTLWTLEELAVRLDQEPAIVEKFFGPEWANEFCVRASVEHKPSMLTTLVEAAKTDPGLADDEVRAAEFQPQRHQFISGDHFNAFHMRNEEIIIETYLPTARSPLASGLISFRQHSAAAIQVGISHSEMITNLFSGRNSGASERRGFYRFRKGDPVPTVVISVSGCVLWVSESTYNHLCEAVDILYVVFMEALIQLDRHWEAAGYQFGVLDKADLIIRLGSLPYWAWMHVRELVRQKGSVVTDGALAELSGGLHELRIHTETPTATVNSGHHLSIWRGPIEDVEPVMGAPNLSVTLFWRPPSTHSRASTEARGKRKYWGCDTVVKWIESELLPACIGVPVHSRIRFWERFLHRGGSDASIIADNLAGSMFWVRKERFLLPRPSIITLDCLLSVLSQLQRFARGNSQSWLPAKLMLGTYTAARFALKHVTLQYLGYIIAKLDLIGRGLKEQHELIAEIDKKAESLSGLESVSCALIDNGLRVLIEIIDNGRNSLSESEFQKISELLEPLMVEHDEQVRLQLHTPIDA